METLQRAMVLQRDGQFPEARSLYQRALEECPEYPDALAMLALVEYSLGDFDRAAVLAAHAERVVPGVAAIQANRRIIEGAVRLRTYRPLIFDPRVDRHPPAGGSRPLVHLYRIAGNPAGGSEWRSIDLARRLRADAEVVLWTENRTLAKIFTEENEVRIVDASRGDVPQGGTLVVAGSYHRVGTWYAAARYRRVVLLCNVVDPLGIAAVLEQLCLPGKPKVELVFASEWLRRWTNLPGHFEPSPIDTRVFRPLDRPARPVDAATGSIASGERLQSISTTTRRTPSDFVVGRLSRDDPVKHHPGAADFYRRLAADGFRVRLMGALPLAADLGAVPGIEILRQAEVPAPQFLQSLDCFTYRTHSAWTEAWGRVVTEAMATGLPVVVHASGGYAQWIRHGENGFLFHRDDEAFEHIRNLANDPALRQSIGAAARRTVLATLSDDAFRHHRQFYLQ